MAVLFPETPQRYPMVPSYEFDHLMTVLEPKELHASKGVAIDSNRNLVYITAGGRVLIFSDTGEFLNTLRHESMDGLWGIAIYRDNLYVTDIINHFIFHFKVRAGICFVSVAGSIGCGIGQFNKPRQLAISAIGDVFVTDCFNNRVQVLDCDLHYQRHISHHSVIQPYDVKLSSYEVYILTCTSPCIHMFTYAGRKIRSLITRGGIGMQIEGSYFFCLDSSENIIISDWSAHQIKIFSKEGTLLHALGEYGHEVGKFYFPYGIALIDHFKLVVVSSNRDNVLQIYSSD